MRDKLAPDARVAQVAARQHGVISVGQLYAAGLERDAISRRVRSGRLHRLHRGVYAVGHRALRPQGHWLAAVLACGEGALLSHHSAAGLWGLVRAPSSPVHVTLPSRAGRVKRSGIVLHRPAVLPTSDRTTRASIPVTTLARTLDDLRRVFSPAEYRNALREAERKGYEAPGREPIRTRSELEDLFLSLCRRHRLPTPEVNVSVAGLEVDFVWQDSVLIVETDGFEFHRGRQAFEADHGRDLQLRLRGYDVLRFSYVQVKEHPAEVAEAIRTALAVGEKRLRAS